jgi:hypothetical protein
MEAEVLPPPVLAARLRIMDSWLMDYSRHLAEIRVVQVAPEPLHLEGD